MKSFLTVDYAFSFGQSIVCIMTEHSARCGQFARTLDKLLWNNFCGRVFWRSAL